jgi:hypothetical protein
VTARGELQPRQGVDGHGIEADIVHVTERDIRLARCEDPAETVAEAGQVAPRDRPVDGDFERARRFQGHRSYDRRGRRNSSASGR